MKLLQFSLLLVESKSQMGNQTQKPFPFLSWLYFSVVFNCFMIFLLPLITITLPTWVELKWPFTAVAFKIHVISSSPSTALQPKAIFGFCRSSLTLQYINILEKWKLFLPKGQEKLRKKLVPRRYIMLCMFLSPGEQMQRRTMEGLFTNMAQRPSGKPHLY